MLKLFKDQRGFLVFTLLPIMLVIVLSTACIFVGAAFAAKKNAYMTYQWFGEAMDFAATAANLNKDLTSAESRTNDAWRWFGYAFSQMTETTFDGSNFTPKGKSIYPGPIRLISFTYAPPGTPLSSEATTAQPGYTAVIEVLVLGAELPFIGPQYVTVSMRFTGVVKLPST